MPAHRVEKERRTKVRSCRVTPSTARMLDHYEQTERVSLAAWLAAIRMLEDGDGKAVFVFRHLLETAKKVGRGRDVA